MSLPYKNSHDRWERLQEDYHADDLLYLSYYTIANSGLPQATQDVVQQAGFETLSDICDMPTHAIRADLNLSPADTAAFVSWVSVKKGFFANQLDILGVMQTHEHLKQGNALAAQDPGYRDWMDANDHFVAPTDVIPKSRMALQDMLESSLAGSHERKAVLSALREGIGKVEKVTALDPKFIHG